jgi:N-dimethylarginine dimethylaminohydrolase
MPQTTPGLRSNIHSMVDRLRQVLVCSPRTAGWDQPGRAARWRELGFLHPINSDEAQRQHEILCHELQSAEAALVELSPDADLSVDAVYAHDSSLTTEFGAVILNPGKRNRVPEAKLHRHAYERLGIPIFGQIEAPGTTEAGDMVWLDAKTLLIGQGLRTNKAGIEQMRALLAPKEVEVFSAPLPYGNGPSACLHLMSLISLLDEHTAVVDLSWLAVETVQLLQARGFRFIEIAPEERDTLACNVLALGDMRLLAIEENRKTNERLGQAGFDVRTFPGTELCINGGGGPTCLTRPLLRG